MQDQESHSSLMLSRLSIFGDGSCLFLCSCICLFWLVEFFIDLSMVKKSNIDGKQVKWFSVDVLLFFDQCNDYMVELHL